MIILSHGKNQVYDNRKVYDSPKFIFLIFQEF